MIGGKREAGSGKREAEAAKHLWKRMERLAIGEAARSPSRFPRLTFPQRGHFVLLEATIGDHSPLPAPRYPHCAP